MIVTFYSYKGGVGRSMAMANVARWFQLLGLNVVAVDWDLEAPGLESFFSADQAQLATWRGRVGLVDLITLYRQDFPSLGLSDAPLDDQRALAADVARLRESLAPLKYALIDVPPPPSRPGDPATPPGQLRLLSAGWREGAERFADYANAVQAIDWSNFYSHFRGQAYIEWLRQSLIDDAMADIVLVDSRTGVTEMGGVCTRHMADVVVVLSAPNRQNIEGATTVARTFEHLGEQAWRRHRPLQLVMVPSRIDIGSRSVKSAFEPMFREYAAPFMPERLRLLERDFWDLRIPYVDDYAFEERLAVGQPDADSDLVGAYQLLAAHIGWLAPDGGRVQQAMRGEFDRHFGPERVRALLDVGDQFAKAWSRIDEELQPRVRELLLRLVQVGAAADEGDSPRPWRADDALAAMPGPLAAALEVGLLRRDVGSDGVERVQLADRGYLRDTPLAAWLNEDRAWLVWRQRLRTYLEDWERTGREPTALLQGSLLEEAEREAGDRSRLISDEVEFIVQSRVHANRPLPTPVQADVEGASPGAPAAAAADRPARVRWIGVAVVVVALLGAGFWALNHSRPSTADSAAASALVVDGRRLAQAGNYAAAIDNYTQALAINPKLIDALVERADTRSRMGDATQALADATQAVALAPQAAAPRVLLARLKADANDTKGALADLAAIEGGGGSLDAAAWALRAKLLVQDGDDEAALKAFDTLIGLGNAQGLVGKAEIFERRGQRDEAAAAYRAVIADSSDSRLRALAEARLAQIAPETVSIQVKRVQALLHLVSRGDAHQAQVLGQALAKAGILLQQEKSEYVYEQVDAGTTKGDVRYFFPADQNLAQRVQTTVQDALAAQGIDQPLKLVSVDAKKLGLTRAVPGVVEIWLPMMNSLRGMRFDVFVCERSGSGATATAEKVLPILERLGAPLSKQRPVPEEDRLKTFGEPPPNGYEIRYTRSFPEELRMARLLAADKDFAGLGSWRLVPTIQPTKGYMSLFICPESPGPGTSRVAAEAKAAAKAAANAVKK